MILYFADKNLTIIGKASTDLPKGYEVKNDKKTEDIETQAVSFECEIPYGDTPVKCDNLTMPGNYILRQNSGNINELYQIIESEKDTDAGIIRIYGEDVGMELLNEVALSSPNETPMWTVTEAVQNTIVDTGFVIGINQLAGSTKTMACSFSEKTRSERIKEIAELFECEVDYRITLSADGHTVEHRYIDIYTKRGTDSGVMLRLGTDIDSVAVTKTIENLATSIYAYGANDAGGNPITLAGYSYDDGDFVVAAQTFDDRDGNGIPDTGYCIQSRSALEKWGRMVDGQKRHITKPYNVDTVDQATLFSESLKYLKSICDIAVNYECSITNLQKKVSLGDTVTVIDEEGQLFLTSRVLKLETSEADKTVTVTLGEYLIQSGGIAQSVRDSVVQMISSITSAQMTEMTADQVREICT